MNSNIVGPTMGATNGLDSEFMDLFVEMFQVESDLDFGVYRILRSLREDILDFFANELPRSIEEAFKDFASADKLEMKNKMDKAAENAEKAGILPEVSPPFIAAKKQYREQSIDIDLQKRKVYDHLYRFFSRYYNDGDFIARLRRSDGTYVIPSHGEEVSLHWQTEDQYYTKTEEYLRLYEFELLSKKKVKFYLENNDPLQKNEDKRFALGESKIQVVDDVLEIPFVFEKRDKREPQAAHNKQSIEEILESTGKGVTPFLDELNTTIPKSETTYLERAIQRWTKRNTFDFFVHRNLRGFLLGSLENYLSSNLLRIEEVCAESEVRLSQRLSMVRITRKTAIKIIIFLNQIEEFKKALWLKKKFVTESDYCITIDQIDEKFYSEIIANEKQISTWSELYGIEDFPDYSDKVDQEFISQHDKLMVDTKFFSTDFKYRLLSSFDDIDARCTGTMIHSESFQALNLIKQKYRNSFDCVYIDPPYNTDSNRILYKNNYEHSSWLSLMYPLLQSSKELEKDGSDGVHVIAIDKAEQHRLISLLEKVHPKKEIMPVSVIVNPGGQQKKHNFNLSGEFALFVYDAQKKSLAQGKRDRDDPENAPDNRDFMNTAKTDASDAWKRESAKNCFFPILVRDEEIIGFGDVCDDDFHPERRNIVREDGVTEVYPVDGDGDERKWVFARQSVEKKDNETGISAADQLYVKTIDGTIRIWRLKDNINLKTVWPGNKFSAKEYGTSRVRKIVPVTGEPDFPPLFPKSIHLVKDCIKAALNDNEEGLVLDYFGGSGTTGHAVINLNRKDGGNRKFVLVEMGDHFETVLKPLIQRVSFCDTWEEGKPDSFESGTSQFLKYLKLESYEDALGSIQVKQTTLLDDFEQMKSEYLMKYALSSKSGPQYGDKLLQDPSKATMTVSSNSGTREVSIDLIETFNLLIGVNVDTLRIDENIVWETGSLQDGKTVLIIWRSHEEFDDKALNEWFSKEGFNSEKQEYAIVYVNGDTTLLTQRKDGQSWECRDIDVDFKSHMFDSWE